MLTRQPTQWPTLRAQGRLGCADPARGPVVIRLGYSIRVRDSRWRWKESKGQGGGV